MEFWGLEVPSGKPVTCSPGEISYIHVSQAALGENKTGKGNERVVLKIKVDEKEYVLGTLSQGKLDQTALDLIVEKEFTVSHTGASSVYLTGYKTDAHEQEDDDELSDEEGLSDSEEDDVMAAVLSGKENGKPKAGKADVAANKESGKAGLKTETPAVIVEKPVDTKTKGKEDSANEKDKAKPQVSKPDGKVKEKVEEVKGEESEDEDEDDSDEDDDEDDEDMLDSSSDDDLGSDDEDEEESEEESDEEEKPKSGAKRPFSGPQNASAGKKNKVETPQAFAKQGKKDVQTSTPISNSKPSPTPISTPKQQQQQQHQKSGKKNKKSPGNNNGQNQGTPNSGKKFGQNQGTPNSGKKFGQNQGKKNFNSGGGGQFRKK